MRCTRTFFTIIATGAVLHLPILLTNNTLHHLIHKKPTKIHFSAPLPKSVKIIFSYKERNNEFRYSVGLLPIWKLDRSPGLFSHAHLKRVGASNHRSGGAGPFLFSRRLYEVNKGVCSLADKRAVSIAPFACLLCLTNAFKYSFHFANPLTLQSWTQFASPFRRSPLFVTFFWTPTQAGALRFVAAAPVALLGV
jgi:hypothetical protein